MQSCFRNWLQKKRIFYEFQQEQRIMLYNYDIIHAYTMDVCKHNRQTEKMRKFFNISFWIRILGDYFIVYVHFLILEKIHFTKLNSGTSVSHFSCNNEIILNLWELLDHCSKMIRILLVYFMIESSLCL